MKKELKELKVHEFTRLCCGVEMAHTLAILDAYIEGKRVPLHMYGTYHQITEGILEAYFQNEDFECLLPIVKVTEDTLVDDSHPLSKLDIYEYLEVKTKDFQEDRCSILLADMQYTHDVIIPQYIVNDIDMHIQLGNVTKKYKMAENGQEILDYDAMHNDLYGQRGGDLYNLAIGILKEKMGIKSDTKADTHRPKELPEELSTHEAKEWLDYCVEKGLLDKDYQPTGKVYTEALKAYLAEKLNEAIFPNQKIHKWKPFETLWGCKGFTKKRYTSREQVGIVRDGEYIDKCFPNKIIEKGKHRK